MQSLKYFTFFKLPKRIYKNENETNDETTLLLCHEITCKTTQKIRRNRIDRKKKSKCDQNHFKSCVVLTMCFFIGFARNCTHCTNKYKKKTFGSKIIFKNLHDKFAAANLSVFEMPIINS